MQKKCKFCHLIYEGNLFKNEINGKVITLTAGGDCKTADTVYAARCKICKLIYVGETKKSLGNRFGGHRYDANSRPENCELSAHVDKEGHEFDKDIEVVILKQGFKSTNERKYWEDKFICQLGTYSPTGLIEKLGAYAKDMYSLYQDLDC